MQKQRPVYLDVPKLAMSLPIPAIISIMHRISGVALFVALPFLLYLLSGTLSQEEQFASYQALVAHPLVKIALLGLLWGYLHHFCAGIRFLFIDIHKGLELPTARLTARLVVVISLALTVILGAWLW